MAARHLDTPGWESAVFIDKAINDCSLLNIDADASGNAIALWSQNNHDELWTNRHESGAGWQAPKQLSSGAYIQSFTSKFDASANAIALWVQESTVGYELCGARNTLGRGWNAPSQISSRNDVAFPSLAVDAHGDAIAAWAGDRISVIRYTPGLGWGTPEAVTSTAGYGYSKVLIAMDPMGRITLLFSELSHTDTHYCAIKAMRFE